MVAYTHYQSDARVVREAEAALEGGFDVDVLALGRNGDPGVERVRGVRVINVMHGRYRGAGLIQYFLSYTQFLIRCFFVTVWMYLKRRYPVVHVNNMPDFMVFCALVPKLFGSKIILDIHDPMPETFQSKFKSGAQGWGHRLLLWQERMSAKFADAVLTVHEPVKEHVLDKHGLSQGKIVVISNFPDERVFSLRQTLPLDGKLHLAFHGTILERSGLRSFVTALSRVRHPQRITAKIIGEGDFAPTLKGLISSLGLSDRVEFVNRSVPVDEIPAALASCNVGVVPLEISAITNFALPLKLLEFISLGMPVVSVRNVAIQHYFNDDECLFYDHNDPEALCAALNRLSEDPELLRHYRQQSIAVRETYCWRNEKTKYIQLLRELACART